MSIKQIQGYQILMTKMLGKGSFGTVYIGQKDNSNQKVAVKIVPKQAIDKQQYLKASLKNQIAIQQRLHSQNIVGFYQVMESSKNYYIIQQLCDGDLSSRIKKNNNPTQAQAVDMLRQICNGFLSLVQEGIIHRDLKPANIMTKNNVLKIGDFGFAKQVKQKKAMTQTAVGTPLYMSLQLLKGEPYTSKCDIWALGFIFYEILHGDTPWTASNQIQLVRNIQKFPLKIVRKDLSANTQDFLRKCLQLSQENRISWDEIFRHPIFNGYFIQNNSENKQFENKLKMIMNKLKHYITVNSLDLKKVLDSLGFTNQKKQVNYYDFSLFFKKVYSDITDREIDYVFKKTDIDSSGFISIEQLKTMLVENGIKIQRQAQYVPQFEQSMNNEQTFIKKDIVAEKLKNCMIKLNKIILKLNLTLWKVFNDFDKKKGFLTRSQFLSLMRKLATINEISDQQIELCFNLINQGYSQTMNFNQLNRYFCKINNLQYVQNANLNEMIDENKNIYPEVPQQGYNNGNNMNNPYSNNYQNNNYQQYSNNNQYYNNFQQNQPYYDGRNTGNIPAPFMPANNFNVNNSYPPNNQYFNQPPNYNNIPPNNNFHQVPPPNFNPMYQNNPNNIPQLPIPFNPLDLIANNLQNKQWK